MKVFISVDMEGITGVVNWDHTEYGKDSYERFMRMMNKEADAAAKGAFDAGASEVIINDSHGGMRNIIIEDLDPRVKLITGSSKPMSMMEGISSDFDAAMFIGYHSRASSTGVLNHTYTGKVANIWVDGKCLGETGINALIAGYYGVPVVFVSGDSVVVEEARQLLGDIQTVAVKEPRSQFSAMCIHPEKAQALIREKVTVSLKNLDKCKPVVPAAPSIVRVQFHTSGHADGASIMPGAVRIDPVTVEFTGKDYLEAYRGARTMMALA